jgi:altronate dehydratase small subunit
MKSNFLVLDARDNIGVALAPLLKGQSITIGLEPNCCVIELQEDIPMGHKFSLALIARGDPIKKYGAVIGRCIAETDAGQHVHLHNVESLRGRGDKA